MSPEATRTDHMSAENIGAFIDGEMTADQNAQARAHLEDCHSCALAVVAAQQLKLATRQAAHRFTPSADVLARLRSKIVPEPGAPQLPKSVQEIRRPRPAPRLAWAALAAVLLLALFLAGSWQVRQSEALSAELLDQHLAVLSDTSSPQVLSSDRHTVKPWFQGRLPFSFNLPEPNQLPADSALLGADMTYVHGRPTALLLFSIHKHRVSVFLNQSGSSGVFLLPGVRSGFQIVHAKANGLELVAVSDVDRTALSALMDLLARAQ